MRNLCKSISFLIYFIVMQVIASTGLIFWKACTDTEWFLAVGKCLESGDNLFSMEYMSLISDILFEALFIADLLIIIPIFITSAKHGVRIYHSLSISDVIKLSIFGIALNMTVSGLVAALPQTAVTGKYDSLMSVVSTGSFGLVFLTSGILAPVIEELVFRFGIINLYKDKVSFRTSSKFSFINNIADALNLSANSLIAILVSSLLFGVAHMNLIQGMYAFFLGLILGYVYVQMNYNLLASTVIHLIINSTSVLYEYAPFVVQIIFLGIGIVCVGISFLYLMLRFLINSDSKYLI